MPTLDELARKGIEAINEKRFEDAIEAFKAALAVDEARPDMNSALGMAYLHRGDVGNAIPHLERAVALAEPYTAPEVQGMKRDFHIQLATAYQLMDRVDDAMRTLSGILKRWPSVPEPYLQLGNLQLSTGMLAEGKATYRDAAGVLTGDDKKACEVLVAAIEAFEEAEQPGSLFLEAHAQSYKDYFDQVAEAQAEHGWYAEAARMARGADGEPVPIVADGARPYALTRVDLVNPVDGTVSGVYSEQEPMVVALQGLEPLAEAPIVFPWNDWPFAVGVCTRCPWHWLQIVIQFDDRAASEDELIARVDELVGGWYLSGYNGEFGEAESGRFHYISDPEPLSDRAVAYTVDLGRARYEAVPTLLKRLAVLHDTKRIDRVLFGYARLR
ncbi:MAG: tetratricopeptide repeat protein [Alphaproteobacteria bacterium]|nr:tetratricopeptide repeat protein [Alphaproteobacteria bacterium]